MKSKSFEKIQNTRKWINKLPDVMGNDIWRPSVIGEKTTKGRVFSLLRIISIIYRGLKANSVFSQAASLSYYTLVGLGPVLAIAIMISSFVVGGKHDDTLIRDSLVKVFYFIAPPAAEFGRYDDTNTNNPIDNAEPVTVAESDAAFVTTNADITTSSEGEKKDSQDVVTTTGKDTTPNKRQSQSVTEVADQIAPRLVDIINQIIDSAKSGTVGIIGSIMLIIIAIQVITVIEGTFNAVWGVNRGRSWLHRLVFYWTFISLGAVLGAGSLFLISYTTIAQFFDQFSINLGFLDLSRFTGTMISFVLAVILLSSFYKFIPNTTVKWVPSLVGAFFVTGALFINHFLSFLYAQRALTTENLYGSVGIVFVFMLGLYIFWVIVLLGGQITYSVQNVNNLSNQKVWDNMSIQSRETLCLATMLITCRRFINRETAPTTAELCSVLHVPSQILNGCLNQLTEMGWLTPIDAFSSGNNDTTHEVKYQPSRPLHDTTLADFDNDFVNLGNSEGGDALTSTDPLLQHLHNADHETQRTLRQEPLADLLKNA